MTVPVHQVLLRTPDLVLLLSDVLVFSGTIMFSVRLVVRAVSNPVAAGPDGPVPRVRKVSGRRRSPSFLDRSDIRIGVKLADGRSAMSAGWGRGEHGTAQSAGPAITLDCLPGGGLPGAVSTTVLLSPVPPAGPVVVVVAIPSRQIREVTTLDGAALQEARERVQPFWPDAEQPV
ncbi:hypothetical protein JL107_02470 [Nakamurella flavida]|uniref:Uncharacterized protein n=1 Tax=Nakamurella flavida TaxID=363630 RepID=A0A938YIM9_9ACTN|nr:hypothetical protein [Nakamurella flavida]MBM9475301.1 hypothetical protein [Nakamurella flavida]MDP9776875.1 hypothetical protein [Nakamurella flavida]